MKSDYLFLNLIPIEIWTTLMKAVLLLTFLSLLGLFGGWAERKIIGRIHSRYGPTYTGKFGLLQTLADTLKFLTKEVIIPSKSQSLIFQAVPIFLIVVPFLILGIIPLGGGALLKSLFNQEFSAILVLALLGILPILIFLGGWSSGDKYSELGGIRAVSQIIAYEVLILISFLGVVSIVGSFNLEEIVRAQKEIWFVFLQPLGFSLFLVGILAMVERQPFDIPEAESELVAGWNTSYSGILFALILLSQYMVLFLGATLVTLLYFGGWEGWGGVLGFFLKIGILIFFMFLARATFLRVRIDQLLKFSWKVLIPFALFNFFATLIIFG